MHFSNGSNITFNSVHNHTNVFDGAASRSVATRPVRAYFHYVAPFAMTSPTEAGIETDILNLIFSAIGVEVTTEHVKVAFNRTVEDFRAATVAPLCARLYGVAYGNLQHTRDAQIASSRVYNVAKIAWFAPLPAQTPRWRYPLHIFSAPTWAAFVASIAAAAAARAALERDRGGVAVVLALLLEQRADMRSQSVAHQLYAVCVVFFVVFFNMFYKSQLTYFLCAVLHEKAVKTIEDAMEAGLKFGTLSFTLDLYDDVKPLAEYMRSHHVVCDTSVACLRNTAVARDAVVATFVEKERYVRRHLMDASGRALMRRLDRDVIGMAPAFLFVRGHPTYRKFDRFLGMAIEGGLVDHVLKRYDRSVPTVDEVFLVEGLTVEHLWAVLWCWGGGILISCGVFVGELFWIVK